MRTRRHMLGALGTAMTILAGCTSGGRSEDNNSGPGLFAPSFTPGVGTIPKLYTCEGGNISPELAISDVSRTTESFAVIMDDPDAPGTKPFTHWLIWNIPPNTKIIPEGIPKQPRVTLEERGTDPGFPAPEHPKPAFQGTNDAGEIGYTGPCPPPSDDAHVYEITLYSLRTRLDVSPGATRAELEPAIEQSLIGATTITARFDR